jgi:GTP-binding protein
MPDKVLILGKPNVGKSSIFNMIVGKNIAIVDNFSGLTRDLKKKEIFFLDKSFELIDSAGLVFSNSYLEEEIFFNTIEFAKNCQILLLVFDGKESLSKEDYEIIETIRKLNKRILPIINKCEGKINQYIIGELENLGLDKAIQVSSAHNQGIEELKFEIYEVLPFKKKDNELVGEEFSIAIVGKTNSGKSTITNTLKGSKVSITGSLPYLTRDAVETTINYKKTNFKIFDTAGFSKSLEKDNKVNKLAIDQTRKKIRLCQFVLIVLDINDYFERLHSKIISLVYSENRCMVIVINKIDTFKSFPKLAIQKKIYELNPQIKGMPIFFVSALEKNGFNDLLNGIKYQFVIWKKRIKTSLLNSWLKKIMKNNPPPLYNGNTVKLKFVTQVDIGPPKFNIFSNYPVFINKQYKRYLANNLKTSFKMNGLPVKIIYKKTSNPYEKK